jgi:hypothetical protein
MSAPLNDRCDRVSTEIEREHAERTRRSFLTPDGESFKPGSAQRCRSAFGFESKPNNGFSERIAGIFSSGKRWGAVHGEALARRNMNPICRPMPSVL